MDRKMKSKKLVSGYKDINLKITILLMLTPNIAFCYGEVASMFDFIVLNAKTWTHFSN